jgi:hypothetical protein
MSLDQSQTQCTHKVRERTYNCRGTPRPLATSGLNFGAARLSGPDFSSATSAASGSSASSASDALSLALPNPISFASALALALGLECVRPDSAPPLIPLVLLVLPRISSKVRPAAAAEAVEAEAAGDVATVVLVAVALVEVAGGTLISTLTTGESNSIDLGLVNAEAEAEAAAPFGANCLASRAAR